MKRKKEKKKEEEENETINKLDRYCMNKTTKKIDRYSMMIISKYFNDIYDFINLEKTNKEYNGIIEQFKYNPIPFKNIKEREVFKNIETYHFYENETIEEEKKIISKDKRIKKNKRIKHFIYWKRVIGYLEWKKSETQNCVYKIIEYEEEDMEKLLLDHEEYDDNFCRIYLKTEQVELEEGITSVGNYCFCNCYNLRGITIPPSVSLIGNECFKYCCNLSIINIPNKVLSIGDGCFDSCSNLSTITIPRSVSSIGDYCFNCCSNLREMDIPSNVISIGEYCFSSCSNLSTITIPSSVSFIGDCCFWKSEKLRGNIAIESTNSMYKTNGTEIYRKDNNEEVEVWCFWLE